MTRLRDDRAQSPGRASTPRANARRTIAPATRNLLRTLQRRARRARLLDAAAVTVAAASGVALAAFVADSFGHFDAATREWIRGSSIAILGFALATALTRALRGVPPATELARRADALRGDVNELLRASVELDAATGSEPKHEDRPARRGSPRGPGADDSVNELVAPVPSSPPLERAVHAGAALAAAEVDAHAVIDTRRPANRLALAALGPLVLAAWAVFSPDRFTALAMRVLSPHDGYRLPTRTVLELDVPRGPLARGSSVEFVARIVQGSPTNARWRTVDGTGRHRDGELERLGTDTFRGRIEGLERSIRWVVESDDFQSDEYSIEVRDPPRPERFHIERDFPDYTGEPHDVATATTGEIRALVGSTVRISIDADGEVRTAMLRRQGPSGDPPVEPLVGRIEGTGSAISFPSFVAERNESYEISLFDPDGLEGQTVHSIRVTKDRPPTVTLLDVPSGSTLVEPTTRLPVRFRAEDDFGIAELSLRVESDHRTASIAARDVSSSPARRRFVESELTVDFGRLGAVAGERLRLTLIALDARGNAAASATWDASVVASPTSPEGTRWILDLREALALARAAAEAEGPGRRSALALVAERAENLATEIPHRAEVRTRLEVLAVTIDHALGVDPSTRPAGELRAADIPSAHEQARTVTNELAALYAEEASRETASSLERFLADLEWRAESLDDGAPIDSLHLAALARELDSTARDVESDEAAGARVNAVARSFDASTAELLGLTPTTDAAEARRTLRSIAARLERRWNDLSRLEMRTSVLLSFRPSQAAPLERTAELFSTSGAQRPSTDDLRGSLEDLLPALRREARIRRSYDYPDELSERLLSLTSRAIERSFESLGPNPVAPVDDPSGELRALAAAWNSSRTARSLARSVQIADSLFRSHEDASFRLDVATEWNSGDSAFIARWIESLARSSASLAAALDAISTNSRADRAVRASIDEAKSALDASEAAGLDSARALRVRPRDLESARRSAGLAASRLEASLRSLEAALDVASVEPWRSTRSLADALSLDAPTAPTDEGEELARLASEADAASGRTAPDIDPTALREHASRLHAGALASEERLRGDDSVPEEVGAALRTAIASFESCFRHLDANRAQEASLAFDVGLESLKRAAELLQNGPSESPADDSPTNDDGGPEPANADAEALAEDLRSLLEARRLAQEVAELLRRLSTDGELDPADQRELRQKNEELLDALNDRRGDASLGKLLGELRDIEQDGRAAAEGLRRLDETTRRFAALGRPLDTESRDEHRDAVEAARPLVTRFTRAGSDLTGLLPKVWSSYRRGVALGGEAVRSLDGSFDPASEGSVDDESIARVADAEARFGAFLTSVEQTSRVAIEALADLQNLRGATKAGQRALDAAVQSLETATREMGRGRLEAARDAQGRSSRALAAAARALAGQLAAHGGPDAVRAIDPNADALRGTAWSPALRGEEDTQGGWSAIETTYPAAYEHLVRPYLRWLRTQRRP